MSIAKEIVTMAEEKYGCARYEDVDVIVACAREWEIIIANVLEARSSYVSPNKLLAPVDVVDSLIRYRDHGVETSSFLRAVLENNLREAIGRADCDNLMALPHIVAWIYNLMPRIAWGSPAEVEEWLKYKEEKRVPKEVKGESG